VQGEVVPLAAGGHRVDAGGLCEKQRKTKQRVARSRAGTETGRWQFNQSAQRYGKTGRACLRSQKAEEGGGDMGDPVLFWTLLAVIAANIILVVLAIRNGRRKGRK
jgi:hypothetical protein